MNPLIIQLMGLSVVHRDGVTNLDYPSYIANWPITIQRNEFNLLFNTLIRVTRVFTTLKNKNWNFSEKISMRLFYYINWWYIPENWDM